MPIIQVFLVEGFVVDGDALIEADFIRFQINLLPGLRVQRRGVREPHENRVRLLHVFPLVSVQDIFDQRGHDDRLAGTGGRSEGNNLGRMGEAIDIQRSSGLVSQIGNRSPLERK